MPLNQRLNKEYVVIYTIDYYSAIKKKCHHEIWRLIDGTGKSHSEQQISASKRQMWYLLI